MAVYRIDVPRLMLAEFQEYLEDLRRRGYLFAAVERRGILRREFTLYGGSAFYRQVGQDFDRWCWAFRTVHPPKSFSDMYEQTPKLPYGVSLVVEDQIWQLDSPVESV
jgi:hypothetical protein